MDKNIPLKSAAKGDLRGIFIFFSHDRPVISISKRDDNSPIVIDFYSIEFLLGFYG